MAMSGRTDAPALKHPWLIVLGLSLGVCVSNGFARFAYGLILPGMRADLDWGYTAAGWINTANALGYVAGAIATMMLIGRISPSRLFSIGMAGTSLCLLANGFTENFLLMSLWRVLAGVFGALTFIAGGTLAASLFSDDPRRNALAIAGVFGGGGLGMALSGGAFPSLFAQYGPDFWPVSWIMLGVASLVCCPVSIWAAAQLKAPPSSAMAAKPAIPLPLRAMTFELTGYGLFAMGYIVYITFLVAWMAELQASAVLISAVWVTVGVGVMISPLVWRPVLARFDNGAPLALSNAAVAVGTLLPIILPTAAGLLASAAIFGVSFFIAPASVTSFSKKNLPQEQWGRGIGLYTTVFAVGQTISPVGAGYIGDAVGGIDAGMLAAALILIIGAGIAALQRPLEGRSQA